MVMITSEGRSALVDSDQRLNVLSTSRSQMTAISQDKGKSYVCYSRRNFVAAATNENILHFTYTGSGKCIITKILWSTNDADAKMEVYKNPIYTSGGTLVLPNNVNFSSGNIANVTAYHGQTDIVMTVDATKELYDGRLSIDMFSFEPDGMVLGKGNSIGLLGTVGTIAKVIRASIFFYEVD